VVPVGPAAEVPRAWRGPPRWSSVHSAPDLLGLYRENWSRSGLDGIVPILRNFRSCP